MASRGAGDLLHLFLYAPEEGSGFNIPVPGRASLQKQIFLVSTTIPGIGTRFEGGRYGPFSGELARAEDDAVSGGTVERRGTGGRGEMLLTGAGMAAGKDRWDGLGETDRIIVTNIKDLMNDMSYIESISSIYTSYTEMAGSAEDLELYKEHRVAAAVSLFIRKKISVSRGSEIAGMYQGDFTDMLYENKIYAFARKGHFQRCIREFREAGGRLARAVEEIGRYECPKAC
ncbi:MAG: UPF0175 family protein [Nitrosopumilus sp.]|nr:UPF0175 family protein [Nitrosopumilus sp.]